MSFKTLRKLSTNEKIATLNEVSAHFLPKIGNNSDFSESAQSLLNELKSNFGVKGDFNEKQITAILKLLSNEIQSLFTAGDPKRIQETRRRVGQKGLLSSNSYTVEITSEYRTYSEGLGVDIKTAESVVRKPIAVEHLSPDLEGLFGVDSHSLFLGHHIDHPSGLILLLAIRDNDVLRIERSWLIFDDIYTNGESPLEVLKKFVERFGLETSIFHSPYRKFHYLEKSTYDVGSGNVIPFELKRGEKKRVKCDLRLSYAVHIGNISVALAFAIDIEEVISYLKSHGVTVSRKLENSGDYTHREFE